VTAPALARWYVRCLGCLSIGCIESERDPSPWRHNWRVKPDGTSGYVLEGGATCEACGGNVETMGRVVSTFRPWLAKEEEQSPCDARCSDARGWKCECPCGAANHGKGAIVVLTSEGGVPRVTVLDPATAKRRAAEWETARTETRAAFDARFGSLRERKASRAWLSPADYATHSLSCRLYDDMRDAAAMRTHKGRLGKLAAVRKACAETFV
jgi:hypothetical protein